MGLIKPHRVPDFLQRYFSSFVFKKDVREPTIYLTFDDGPIPEVTPWVLSCLKDFEAHATFFMVGDNVRKHPEVFKQVLEEGHLVGNHTFNHLKGWSESNADYLENIGLCQKCFAEVRLEENSFQKPLFRPPHGQIKPGQVKEIRDSYKIILWDVLTCDYDQSLKPEEILEKTIELTRSGSIVVFHDSLKAERNVKFVLPRYISHFKSLGFKFETL
ncbi:polysaccharide deacetylase family protein [Persicobacter sp. CCB-QB2]|uniref:polysaccharide deacetylase family protein n=1 Tax=Persicobacter sp. CCB-QB2 TaxID=1561025 RepID=UPI0006A983FE|nr:polysaccharide deacetylase family protein [Persicobacter sp. CCB-QB2]